VAGGGQKSERATDRIDEVLLGQLGLLAVVVILIGIVVRETYYADFGIGAHAMTFDLPELVYRGLKAMGSSGVVLLLVLSTAAWLSFCRLEATKEHPAKVVHWRIPATYLLVLLLLPVSFFEARAIGHNMARLDMASKTSTLPHLFVDESGKYAGFDGCRVLVSSGEALVVFRPTSGAAGEAPVVHFIKIEGSTNAFSIVP
jgi:hypothetical protein